jgi:hypothetical protein
MHVARAAQAPERRLAIHFGDAERSRVGAFARTKSTGLVSPKRDEPQS